jgi:hypothetical protein
MAQPLPEGSLCARLRAVSARRPYRDPLVVFLGFVALVMALALWQRLARPSFAETLVLLREGDVERSERMRLWRSLLEQAPTREHDLAAAMAALCLGDEGRYLAFAQRLGASDPLLRDADAAMLPAAALGEPCLEHLLAGWLLEGRGQREAARRAYEQAAAAAPLWGLPLAGGLARQGLLRVR